MHTGIGMDADYLIQAQAWPGTECSAYCACADRHFVHATQLKAIELSHTG